MVDEQNKNNNIVSSDESIKLKENENLLLNLIENKDIINRQEFDDLDSITKIRNLIDKESKNNKDDLSLKNMTNNQICLEMHRKNMQKCIEEDHIDVENYSDEDTRDNDNLILNKSSISKSRSSSTSSSRSSSSTRSSELSSQSSRLSNSSNKSNNSNNNSSIKDESQSINDQNTVIKNEENINKNKRQRFHSNYSTTMQKQNATSILINGKRYYQLKFSCENCGLRYSDQGTLNTHKLNYCSKRVQSSSEKDDSKERTRSSSGSKTSRSNSPQSIKMNIDGSESETNNQIEIKDQSISKNSEKVIENNEMDKEKNSQDINQTKTVIYQCNSCLFQTDKKSNMNKHSRVHLPQKRKAMEESTLQNNNNNIGLNDTNNLVQNENIQCLKQENKQTFSIADKQNDIKPTEINDSYCKDCDIQFSSMKTYLHHRNNYCQKYKTIEISPNDNKQQTLASLVPNKTPRTIQTNKTNEELKNYMSDDDRINKNKKNENVNSLIVNNPKNQDEISQSMPSFSSNIPSIYSSPISSFHIPKQQLISNNNSSNNPPNAVCMGDLVYLPVYKLNNQKESTKESNLNIPIKVPLQIPSTLLYNAQHYQSRKYPSCLDPKLLDAGKLETLPNWNNLNEIQRSSDVVKNLFKRKRNSSDSSERSLKIDYEDEDEENDQDNGQDSPLDLSTKTNSITGNKKHNVNTINDELLQKSQRLINNAYLNGLISPIENDSIKNYLNKKQKTNLNNEVFLRNNSIYYSDLIKNYSYSLIHEQTNSISPSNFGVSCQQSIQNLKYQNALIELANYQKHNNTSHFNNKKKIESVSDMPSASKPFFPTPLLTQNKPIPASFLEQNNLYKCNYCKEIFNIEKGYQHKCLAIQNIINRQKSLNNNQDFIKESSSSHVDSISVYPQSTESRQFSNLLERMVLNPMLLRKNLNEQPNENVEDKDDNKIESLYGRSSSLENKINCMNEESKEELEDLLRHPLVKKTLTETYGGNDIQKLFSYNESINEDDMSMNNRQFFICTNCGYRGNTSRGVKQHGKMHINNNEHFGIINATEKYPLIVYNSRQDSDIKIIDKVKQKIELINDSIEDEETTSNNSNSLTKHSETNCVDSSENNISKMLSLTKDMRSETYCFKCGIQFQHIKNFLAHKKSYCNDN